ncbi:MAG: carboxypeptidase-like regulatory domain-containing protein [Pyrinomonadaceae bacterium]
MNKSRKTFSIFLLATAGLCLVDVPSVSAEGLPLIANATSKSTSGFGTIRGLIRDEAGAPIAGALIALFRDGVATVRQVRSEANGSFSARVSPGRYSLTAMAEGFSVVSLANVDVERAEDVAFRFNLVRTGSGNTLPELRADRNQPKWRTRSNNARRTIFQNNEGTGETTAAVEKIETTEAAVEDPHSSRYSQGTVETYFASSANGDNYAGLNFAAVQPINENLDLIVAGQTGFGAAAPQRLETTARLKLNHEHRISLNVGGAQLGKISLDDKTDRELGQLSFQALDEWRVQDGVIVVVGIDYSRFIGASNAFSVAPRLGLQFEANAKTRFNIAYTTQNESRNWSEAADLEDNRVLFRAPDVENYVVADKQVLMPKMRRLEFGVERVLDNFSSVEATAFFDTTSNRGVSFVTLPLTAFGGETEANDFTDRFSGAVQNGQAQGVRVVYSRRLNEILSTSVGYAFGRGQSLSDKSLSNPANLFEDEFFQTVTAQIAADFGSGTQIRTVWRYSPRSAVFAIDPFAGRIAYYEPSLSVMITQNIPTWGLPLRAKAMLDARNLFDLSTATANGEQSLQLNSNRRILRGGIAVRF